MHNTERFFRGGLGSCLAAGFIALSVAGCAEDRPAQVGDSALLFTDSGADSRRGAADTRVAEGLPGDTVVGDAAVGDAVPRDSTPRDSTPRDSLPRDSTPRDSTPRDWQVPPADLAPSNDISAPLCRPTAESCDGLDNDCDGVVDNGLSGCDSCAFDLHELPIVTHWSSAAQGYVPLASDQIDAYMPYSGTASYKPGTCYRYYRHGDYPDYGAYPGDRYAFEKVSDQRARDFARRICREMGVPVSFFRPDAFSHRAAGLGHLRDRPGRIQILHGKEIAGGLFTVYLPPNWSSKAATGSYPIVANGFYDLNANVFGQEGVPLVKTIALSGIDGRTGAIGLIWNGGAAVASRTMNRQAFDQFAAAIDWVAKNLGGDRNRLLMWGASRGGYTTVAMASNPYKHDYRVVFAAPGAMPTLIGEHAELQSPTYPGLLTAVPWSTGLHDAWRYGWRYPSCAGKAHLTGKSGPEAHSYLLTGTADFHVANTERSPLAKRFIDGLKAANPEIYMEVTAHDNIVPYIHQLQYAKRLLAEGLKIEVDVLIRGGHISRNEVGAAGNTSVRFNALIRALQVMVEKGVPPYHVTTGMKFFRVNRQSRRFEPFVPVGGVYPFTVELPYRAVRGERMVMVFAGHSGTDYELDIVSDADNSVATYKGTIGATMREITWIDLKGDLPLGIYRYRLRIKKPGQSSFTTIPATNTPSGTQALTYLEAQAPNVDASGALKWSMGPVLPGFGNTNWGISEY